MRQTRVLLAAVQNTRLRQHRSAPTDARRSRIPAGARSGPRIGAEPGRDRQLTSGRVRSHKPRKRYRHSMHAPPRTEGRADHPASNRFGPSSANLQRSPLQISVYGVRPRPSESSSKRVVKVRVRPRTQLLSNDPRALPQSLPSSLRSSTCLLRVLPPAPRAAARYTSLSATAETCGYRRTDRTRGPRNRDERTTRSSRMRPTAAMTRDARPGVIWSRRRRALPRLIPRRPAHPLNLRTVVPDKFAGAWPSGPGRRQTAAAY